MPKYRPLPENGELVDVLSCVILGHNTVKNMIRVLKQPQSTISEKLRFLIKSGAIKKHKWDFEANWNALYKIFYQTVKEHFDVGLIRSKEPTNLDKEKVKSGQQLLRLNLKEILPDTLIKNILTNYSSIVITCDYSKLSILELTEKFLDMLSVTSNLQLKEADKFYNSNLLQLKKLLKYRAIENESLFLILVSPP